MNKPKAVRAGRIPVKALVATMLAGDRDRALESALGVRERVGSRVGVFVDLLQPAQYQIGEMWYDGRIRVDDEHRATAIAEWITEQIPSSPAVQPPPVNARCVMAAMGDEQHLLGLRQLQLAFEDDGWQVTRMGPRAPAAELIGVVRDTGPALVCISAGYLPRTTAVEEAVAAIRGLRIPVLVGGSAFNRSPELWRRVGADHHAADARVALVLARRLLR